MKEFSIYILTTRNHKLFYSGYTANLNQRIWEHRNGFCHFTKKYSVTKLVYYLYGLDNYTARCREISLKRYNRVKKRRLIETINPEWEDLYTKID